MSALLFGSISTLADTSELQRQAFNQAFDAHGLDWEWNRDDYRDMIAKSGGQSRVAQYAKARGEDVDAARVHATKSRIFRESLPGAALSPRDGVLDAIRAARDAGWRLGLVTTTSPENVTALLDALGPDIDAADFDVVVDSSRVPEPKPDRAAYVFAIEQLSEQAGQCVAIEDNVNGVESAVAAGVTCVAFPNQNTAGHDFAMADARVERLDPAQLRHLLDGA